LARARPPSRPEHPGPARSPGRSPARGGLGGARRPGARHAHPGRHLEREGAPGVPARGDAAPAGAGAVPGRCALLVAGAADGASLPAGADALLLAPPAPRPEGMSGRSGRSPQALARAAAVALLVMPALAPKAPAEGSGAPPAPATARPPDAGGRGLRPGAGRHGGAGAG